MVDLAQRVLPADIVSRASTGICRVRPERQRYQVPGQLVPAQLPRPPDTLTGELMTQ